MKRMMILVFWAPAPCALAGCLGFGDPKAGSSCRQSSAEMVWLNAPASPQRGEDEGAVYDRTIDDPAFKTGVYVAGDVSFEFRGQGRHLVEVFLTAMDARYSYVLEVQGTGIDKGYEVLPGPDRYMPGGSRMRRVALAGIVEGGQTIQVRTDAPRYLLTAIRWTPQETFESKLVPAWLERARLLVRDPFQDNLLSRRSSNLQYLCSRLVLSRQGVVKREGLLGLTRAFYWVAAENHRPQEIERTRQLFYEGVRVMPDDKILREMISAACSNLNSSFGMMPQLPYCEKIPPVPWEVSLTPPPAGAPEWAVEQRKLAARLDAITRWWVEKRQLPNGQLGGTWDDDVEVFLFWSPQALGLGSKYAVEAIRKLADGVWLKSGLLQNGFDRRISDVEHSSELTTDTVPIRVAIAPDDPAVIARMAESAACAENWIIRQPDGRWRFRGAWFNCREFDPKPERAVDVHYNVRAMGPALWQAYQTRDPKLIRLLTNWAESWVEAMRSTQHGKPAGLFPSAVRSVDGSYLVGSEEWDKPEVEWDYFQWRGEAQEGLTSLVLALYDLTGEKRWLAAAGESFQIMERCSSYPGFCEEMKKKPQAFYEWRRQSGDSRYDRAYGYTPPGQDLPSALSLMASHARRAEARLSVNFDMLTSEVMYTDRIYDQMTPEYEQLLFGGEAPRGERYPFFAVTWPAIEGEFGRSVIEAGETALKLHLYNFGSAELQAPVRFWRLQKGRYQWVSRDRKGVSVGRGEVVISSLPQAVPLPLPPQKEVTITLEWVQP